MRAFTPVIMLHAASALMALSLGVWQLAQQKGGASHRLLGRAWMGVMIVVVLSSFAIRESGGFSWIHLLSLVSAYALLRAYFAIRRGNIAEHRGYVMGAYAGLCIAGVFTLLPGRRLGDLLWGLF